MGDQTAIPYPPDLMSAYDLHYLVERETKDLLPEVDTLRIPWSEPCSDHLPIKFIDPTRGIRILSWNCLNRKHLKWLQPDIAENGRDQSQRLHGTMFADEGKQVQDAREEAIAVRVVDWINTERFVVCLQEVSNGVLKRIQRIQKEISEGKTQGNFADMRVFVTRERFAGDEPKSTEDDRCMILWNDHEYAMVGIPRTLRVPGIRDETSFIAMRKWDSGVAFTLVNVHIKYGFNKQYARRFLELFASEETPTVIVGDFNCSARDFDGDTVDGGLSEYRNSAFKFPRPEAPFYTGVQTYKNVFTTRKMLDKIDYVMLMNYNI